ncbi:MAG: hypothetical protein PQJ46_15930 [Spirochaetales bacterium]|nr:hypothetical protein [Spirochaetales bacterium]
MEITISAIIAAAIFYVIFPLSGAFSVRRRWRRFRQLVINSSLAKEITYSDPERDNPGESGLYSFTGELQAIQGDNVIWLNNGKVSVKAEMDYTTLYLLPSSDSIENENQIEENKNMLPKDMPKKISWKRVYSLEQGTGILLYGNVDIENGTPVFRNTEQNPLFVIIFDGEKETVLRRSIWSGRQLNEYWHTLTPISLIAGSFLLFVMSYVQFRNIGSNLNAEILLILSMIPIFPFCPPGLFFYFAFRYFWKTGRYLRGERDLLRLVERFPSFEEVSSCEEALKKFPSAKLRSCGIISDSTLMKTHCRVYADTSQAVGVPLHFYEKLIIPGNPEVLAKECRKKARMMEILASILIITGLLLNTILIFIAFDFFF